ncbi:LysR family transcriptional regulator [Stutzerimonas frequens]|uniref:LysR family transcriptional regulator n=1 Tax=Stutzerimonas frequens TaxID=2968969 RepID=A0AA47E7P8_9GAMM|nr:LysR family transcriptional regulator [Stutzerimonas frequens]KZX52049.1 LysR family transcriptional regulator [Stutzerimonas frequens]MBK3757406.1 LysR family transcriptional regulator [Stutzerimonas frequens]MBK3872018.1 LysR family transcriptional regulator [Stutzerimonas frequens]MBK3910353.1 LysR family transcriptional regulator [Stutzerimonas frequens]MBK3928078.1 LysR family transcriptional regulator [Stutzerimonas frequens]
MDLANLNAFIAVAETHSFSLAAERLHLTQPAVSKRIAALEAQLDVRLFDRLGREISLTEAGRALLPRAYQILNVLDDTRRALTNLNGDIGGRLSLATSHHIGLHRLPPLLRAFTRAHPQVSLDIRFLDSEVAYDEVLHGRAELAVITLAPQTAEPVLAVKVWDDPLDFVVAPEHPLAAKADITLADIAGHPAVFPGGNTFTHHIAQRLFEREGLTPNITMSTNYMETIKMMVSIGIAWSVLPRRMLDDQVVSLPLPGIQLTRQLGYILHRERTLSNAAKAFIALLDAEHD